MTQTRHYQGLVVSEGLAAGLLYPGGTPASPAGATASPTTADTPATPGTNPGSPSAIPSSPSATPSSPSATPSSPSDGSRAGATPDEVRDAFAAVAQERYALAAQLRDRGRADEAEIVTIGALIAADSALVDPAVAATAEGADAADAVRRSADAQAGALAALADPDLAARADDVRQVASAVLAHLAGSGASPPPATSFILVQREVDPADLIRFAEAGLVGAVSVSGSATSHAAIIARGLGVPMLAAADPGVLAAPAGHQAILDAVNGRLIVNPSPQELAAVAGPGALEATGAAQATQADSTWVAATTQPAQVTGAARATHAGTAQPVQTADAAQTTPTANTAPAAAAARVSEVTQSTGATHAADATHVPGASQAAYAAGSAQTADAARAAGAAQVTGGTGAAGASWRDGGNAGPASARMPRTADGQEVTLLVNVASAAETRLGLAGGAAGVGLLRTEIPFTRATGWPTEAEHAAALDPVLGLLTGRLAVVRLLDFSGDKVPPFLAGGQAGQAGLAALLAHPRALGNQLRAVLRSGRDTRLGVMVPMVTSPDEVARVKASLADAAREASSVMPEIGMMVEVASTAAAAERFAPAVDFFSIGTNDLTSEVLGLDRADPGMRPALAADPRVLALIAHVVTAAGAAGVKVSVCGDAAADPAVLPLLIGLGVRTFSVGAARLPQVAGWIGRADAAACAAAAGRALRVATAGTARVTAP